MAKGHNCSVIAPCHKTFVPPLSQQISVYTPLICRTFVITQKDRASCARLRTNTKRVLPAEWATAMSCVHGCDTHNACDVATALRWQSTYTPPWGSLYELRREVRWWALLTDKQHLVDRRPTSPIGLLVDMIAFNAARPAGGRTTQTHTGWVSLWLGLSGLEATRQSTRLVSH